MQINVEAKLLRLEQINHIVMVDISLMPQNITSQILQKILICF